MEVLHSFNSSVSPSFHNHTENVSLVSSPALDLHPQPRQPEAGAADLFSLDMVASELSAVNIPCLLLSTTIIICCMLACDLLYTTIANNVVYGTFRSRQ